MTIVTRSDFDKLKKIQNEINQAYAVTVRHAEKEDAWRALFNFVFTQERSGVVCNIVPEFDWYDPDTTYQEDVCAFIRAYNHLIEEIETYCLIIESE